MTRSLITLTALLLVTGCTAEEPDMTSEPLTSDGWGVLRIGMTEDELRQAVGTSSSPVSNGSPRPVECVEFHPDQAPEGVSVMVESGRVTRISLTGKAQIKTGKKLGLGASAEKVKDAYDGDAIVTPAKYDPAPAEDITVWTHGAKPEPYVQSPDARGLRYQIGNEGKVKAIRAGGPSIQYVEGCG